MNLVRLAVERPVTVLMALADQQQHVSEFWFIASVIWAIR